MGNRRRERPNIRARRAAARELGRTLDDHQRRMDALSRQLAPLPQELREQYQ